VLQTEFPQLVRDLAKARAFHTARWNPDRRGRSVGDGTCDRHAQNLAILAKFVAERRRLTAATALSLSLW
jgi:hypothetical protein